MTDRPAYMAEPWFALFNSACEREGQRKTAARLGVSDAQVSQVRNGGGHYGSGRASTKHIADLVLHKFGSYECPHLTQLFAEPRVITAPECRSYAHRAAPVGSAGQLDHWRACNTCPHKPLSAPAAPREVKPRGAKGRTPSTPATPDTGAPTP